MEGEATVAVKLLYCKCLISSVMIYSKVAQVTKCCYLAKIIILSHVIWLVEDAVVCVYLVFIILR